MTERMTDKDDQEWQPKQHQKLEPGLCRSCPDRFKCEKPCFPTWVPM